MIERCPHCHHDVLFSRDICPECGRLSRENERTEPTALQQEMQNSRVPVYSVQLDSARTTAEERGHIQLGLISAVLLAPDTVCVVFQLACLFSPYGGGRLDIFAALRLYLVYRLVRYLWQGKQWARRAAGVLAVIAGIAAPVILAFGWWGPNPLLQFALVVFAMLLLGAAIPLWASTDLGDYLKLRRKLHQPPPPRPRPPPTTAPSPDGQSE